MAATQRPIQNIPLAAHRFMAERAQAREVVEMESASHAFTASHPDEVAGVILRAVKDVVGPLSPAPPTISEGNR